MKAALRAIRALLAPDETPIAPRSGVIGGLITMVSFAIAFIAAIAFEAGLTIERFAGGWSDQLATTATVRIDAPRESIDAVARAALRVLETAPGVASARLLDEAELQALLAPWLGRNADLAALPAPALIDVSIETGGPDAADLQRQLNLAAPGAVYDDHAAWRAPLSKAALGVRRIAFAGALLALTALGAMVAIAAAASLWAGSAVVQTLRLIGAEDRFISRAFERQFALRAAIGGVFGATIAMIVVAHTPRFAIADVFAPDADAGGLNLWLALAAPAVCALVALGATRLACFFVLRRRI